jgi:hypothetical protein
VRMHVLICIVYLLKILLCIKKSFKFLNEKISQWTQ